MKRDDDQRDAPPLIITERTATRFLELLRQCDVRRDRSHVPLFRRACALLREKLGVDLERLDCRTVEDVCVAAEVFPVQHSTLAIFVSATFELLRRQGLMAPVQANEFEARVNQILVDGGAHYRLRDGAWIVASSTEAEVLRRILLRGDDELSGCRQGDQQVEMVVSTVQARLSNAGAVLVDYGAGLGRVLAGLAEAQLFQAATYVAVDEPVPDAVKALAGTTGATAQFVGRSEYLAQPLKADVIMVVNTLHHIPFREVASQLSVLFNALKPGGIILVHEMGMLRAPEQRNVPWRVEDLYRLFSGSAFAVNPRSTVSRSGVPLAHVLVERSAETDVEPVLQANVREVWRQMKTRSLEEIATLYAVHDESREVELQYALIVNANLDLNGIDVD